MNAEKEKSDRRITRLRLAYSLEWLALSGVAISESLIRVNLEVKIPITALFGLAFLSFAVLNADRKPKPRWLIASGSFMGITMLGCYAANLIDSRSASITAANVAELMVVVSMWATIWPLRRAGATFSPPGSQTKSGSH